MVDCHVFGVLVLFTTGALAFCSRSTPKLLDFGVAKLLGADAQGIRKVVSW
jgi:hypothetical protein